MKNIFFIALFAALSLFSCKESCIDIPEIQAGNRTVLVEELTGVRCQGCPGGATELVRLDSIHGENLIIISVHAAGNFSFPYSASEFPPDGGLDFRFSGAQEVASYLGELQGFPTASFDRHVFDPNPSPFLINAGTWGGFIAQRLQQPAEATLSMDANYNPNTRELNVAVSIFPEMDLTGDLRISVMVTEDNIINPQKDGPDFVPDYNHRHVLRDIISAPLGDPITESFVAGGLIEKSFSTTLSDEWVANECSVVAFVHRNDGDKEKDVLQAAEVHLEE